MRSVLCRLNESSVKAIRRRGYHPDGGGLYLQVSKTGTKSWIFRYTRNKRTRDMGLGALAYVSLADARQRVAEARALLRQGVDPVERAYYIRTIFPKTSPMDELRALSKALGKLEAIR